MGWFWGNTPVKDETTSSQANDQIPHTTPAPEPSSTDSNPFQPPRDEQPPPDNQLHALLEELRSQNQPRHTSSTVSASSTSSSEPSIHPNALYPKTMSCREAFDTAFYCQSLGGQFTNVYRYGGIRNCSEEWRNFWFCMRTNRGLMDDEERGAMIQEHYRKRETKYKIGPSSEDVWRLREVRVENPFEADLETLEAEERNRH